MNNGALYRKVLNSAFFLCMAALLCRITGGLFSIVMVVMGLHWAATRQYGKALACYAFFPFLVVTNPFIVPKPSIMGWALRLGPLLIGLVLVLVGMNRKGRDRLPLGTLFLYLTCAIASSIGGWAPKISLLKMANFIFFILGFWVGTQNLQDYPKELESVRIFILALACITVFGSLCTLPFPAIAYPLDLGMAKVFQEEGIDAATAYFQSRAGGMTLFAGITFHSQTLGPLLSCLFVLVLADVLFVSNKITGLHLTLLAIMPIMLFMTRSRTAFLSFLIGLIMVLKFAVAKARIVSINWKTINRMAKGFVALILLGLVMAEVSNNTITRWIRKSDDIQGDSRSLTDAVTETRMGLMEKSLNEFKLNPLLGMGFQVNYETQVLFGDKPGLVLSAPVEKGLLPIMVLGEGGIVGVIAFAVFIVSFYCKCSNRGYVVTAATFTTFLATNMGEATFFSPGGAGGIEWVLTAVGGFVIDMILLNKRRMARFNVFAA